MAWFFYSDAISTSMGASITFARVELDFTGFELIMILFEFEIACAVGGVVHLWAQKKIGWDSRQMMMYHMVFYSVITVYILIGAAPNASFGLVQKWEAFVVTWFYGMNAASLTGICTYINTVSDDRNMV